MDIFDWSSLCETLAEEIGTGNISVGEANRILKNTRATVEDIYFGDEISLKEFEEIHHDY